MKHITPKEAFEKMTQEGYVYLDVRTPEEFAAGHPKGAINIPIFLSMPEGRQFNPKFLEWVQQTFSIDKKLVVGCQSGGGPPPRWGNFFPPTKPPLLYFSF